MSYFKPLSLLLILSTLFQISYTQIEAPKEEPLEFPFEEEPHYVDGKHNPSSYFQFIKCSISLLT